MPRIGSAWTQVQLDAINDILDKKLNSEEHIADMRLTVSDVPTRGGQLQIYSEIENREGYHIRFFGGFPDEKKAELAEVKIGEGDLARKTHLGPLSHLVEPIHPFDRV